MKIYLTDKNKVYTYEIREVKRVTPDRVDEVDDRDGVNEITLVTCEDLAATERIISYGIKRVNNLHLCFNLSLKHFLRIKLKSSPSLNESIPKSK